MDRREHAQGQAIDFEDPEFIQIVFVPLDDRPPGHRSVFDWAQFAQIALRHDHATGVLGQVPREAQNRFD